MIFRKRTSTGRAPVDLPNKYSWARDELVSLRLANNDLRIENMRLRAELAKARGGSLADELNATLD